MPDEAEKTEKVESKEEVAEQSQSEEKEKFDEARAMELIHKLREENKALSKDAKRAKELEDAEAKRKEAEMSELEKAQKKTAELEAELKASKLAILRRDVAEKAGLPAALVDRLRGETPEELEADAKALLEIIPKSKEPPKIAATNPGGASTGETEAQALARIHGKSESIFDMSKRGGTRINE